MSGTDRRNSFLINIFDKLGDMPLEFGISDPMKCDGALTDAMRELGMSNLDGVAVNSIQELVVEYTAVKHMLIRMRHSSSVYFKYSTGDDGKSVDKTKVPDMISHIISDVENIIKSYKYKPVSGIATIGGEGRVSQLKE